MRLSLTQQIFHVGRVKLGIFPLGTPRVWYVGRTQFASGLKRLSSDDSVEGANRFHFCVVRTGLETGAISAIPTSIIVRNSSDVCVACAYAHARMLLLTFTHTLMFISYIMRTCIYIADVHMLRTYVNTRSVHMANCLQNGGF